jgi:FAD/FMN-containing dehydrogenase
MTAPWTLPATFQVTGQHYWQNYHRNLTEGVTHIVDVWNPDPSASTLEGYNATTRGLQEAIGYALHNHLELRAVGGRWSWAPVAVTDGVLLNTRPLNYRFRIGPQFRASQQDPRTLLFVQCGTSIADLNTYLKARQLSLKTSGASNGQTIAGALSTGTHGAAIDVGAVPDYVVGLHLVCSPTGKTVWLERKSDPVTTDGFADKLGATRTADDDLFNAALVSFGSFGIIHGVLIEVSPLYYLQAWRKVMPRADLKKAMERLEFAGVQLPRQDRPFHFQVVLNPYDKANAYVTVMYRYPSPQSDCQPSKPAGKIGPGENALEIIGAITDAAPDIVPATVSTVIKAEYGEYAGVCGTHGEIFGDTTTQGRTFSTAMGIPLANVTQAVEVAEQAVHDHEAPALVALRYVKSSRGTLAFTSHGERTCVLEMDGPWSARTQAACEQAWKKLTDDGIPYTFHWGKVNNLDDQRVRSMYGDRVKNWLAARRALLGSDRLLLERVFANRFLRQLDLHT